jgi:hypothetical protein
MLPPIIRLPIAVVEIAPLKIALNIVTLATLLNPRVVK